MIDFENHSEYNINDLIKLLRILRGPEGCPWDREQTHESIRRNLLEEAYEAASAIDDGNADDMLEELGDILLQVLFHAHIAEDNGTFTFDDVIDATCKKLIRRHPHVFKTTEQNDNETDNSTVGNSDIRAENGDESLSIWDRVKRDEKKHDTTADAMDSVAHAIPALWRAEKIQKKAAKAGYDWPDYTGPLETLLSEIEELKDAIKSSGVSDTGERKKNIEEELGDILFSAVNIARFFDADPEEALNNATGKFTKRFRRTEQLVSIDGKSLSDMTQDEIEAYYERAKSELEM